METTVHSIRGLFDRLLSEINFLDEGIEPQFVQMLLNFDNCRRKWCGAEQDLSSCKELLAKSDSEKGALEVKLKHARNQVDVEIRRRQKAEDDCEKLERQIQLMRDLLFNEGSNSIRLNEEQRSALAFLSTRQTQAPPNMNTSRRLVTIDESGTSILSDSCYDQTDDSIDWDSSNVRTVRLKKRQKRRSSRHVDGPPLASKRTRSSGKNAEQGNDSIVAQATITMPAGGGPVEATATCTVPYWTRSRRQTAGMEWDSESLTSVTSNDVFKQPAKPEREMRAEPRTPQKTGGVRLHDFVSKTVIKPESCVPCGKRIKFGKIALKCKDCKVVAHPECRERSPLPCIPNMGGTPVKIGEGVLADFVSGATSPMIPSLVVHCISEIEQRGLHEEGLYRLSGADRTVKELKNKFMSSRTVPLLSKVEDIHAVTGLLKDFLRSMKEPLLTFRLNRPFMDAAEVSDDDNSIALMYQTISDLPQANRDTLAFLVLHLQKVAQSEATRMDIGNLSRVFAPTIVGHSVANPGPLAMLEDTKRQPKVVQRLLALPADYWRQYTMVGDEHPQSGHMIIENANCYATPDRMQASMLGPLTTPEHHQMNKTPSSSSLSQRMMASLTPRFGSKSKSAVGFSRPGTFFESPHLK